MANERRGNGNAKPTNANAMPARRAMHETLAPPRNFFISTADRVRAAAGPPAFSRRKRHIEDLEASLVAAAIDAFERLGDEGDEGNDGDEVAVGAAWRELEDHAVVAKDLREINRLIVAHNLYYPIEANLRLDPATRQQLDRGRPWQPLPAVSLADIVRLARVARRQSSD